MQLLVEPSEKRAISDVYTDRLARFPDFQQGDTVPLSVGIVNRIGLPWNSLVFAPIDISTWAIRATIETEVVASLETDSDPPDAVVTVEQVGDGTHNHKVSVTLPLNRYAGEWTFTVADVESGLIGYDDNAAQVKAIIEATSGGVGTGNVEVTQTDDDEYLIEFVGALALQPISGIAVDGSTLKVISTKSGTMDLRTLGIAALFANGDTEKVVALTILGTPIAGTEQILMQRDIVLRAFEGEYEPSQPIAIAGTIYDTIIDALTGTANALETVPTATLGLKTKINFVIDDSEQSWVLKSGPAGAGEIAPLDYDADTNDKHWTKVGGY